jgi:hypothetical protein
MSARILIVDDEMVVIKSCLRILGGGDYHVERVIDRPWRLVIAK